MRRLKPIGNFVHTITFDNGKEFAAHQDIAHALKAKIFFATPYHAWERGLNENTNGLIRDFFPKGTDFSTISNADSQGRTFAQQHATTPKVQTSFRIRRVTASTPSLTLKFLCAGKLNPRMNLFAIFQLQCPNCRCKLCLLPTETYYLSNQPQ